MFTCKNCSAFISGKTISFKYNKWSEQVKDVKGFCKRCKQVVNANYDDFSELGIEDS